MIFIDYPFSFNFFIISAFAFFILSTNGILLGQTKLQQPHSKQSKANTLSASSYLSCLEYSAIIFGINITGHASTHAAHLMHGFSFSISILLNASIPEVPLITGTSAFGWAMPIKGPPAISLNGSLA